MNVFTLAGSTQLDAATPDPTGIVVQIVDYICADSDRYDIGVDCNGAPGGGGCPGPDFNTQFLAALDTAGEPFTLSDSNSDGTLSESELNGIVNPKIPALCGGVVAGSSSSVLKTGDIMTMFGALALIIAMRRKRARYYL